VVNYVVDALMEEEEGEEAVGLDQHLRAGKELKPK